MKKSISSHCLFFFYKLGRYFRTDLLLLILLLLKWWPYLFLLETVLITLPKESHLPSVCLSCQLKMQPLLNVLFLSSHLCFLLSDFGWISLGETWEQKEINGLPKVNYKWDKELSQNFCSRYKVVLFSSLLRCVFVQRNFSANQKVV